MRIGVGIISWNRPEYLEKLLASLEKNDLTDTEFHLFQDGAVCKFTNVELANPHDILESISVFNNSNIPNKRINLRGKNVSVAINQFEAMRVLSSLYEQFIFIENDVVVSPNFITIMKKLLRQFATDERVACISPGFRPLCKKDAIEDNWDRLVFSAGHFWAEACWSNKWEVIEKEFLPYYNIVKNAPYRERNSKGINSLFANGGMKMPATSQDNAKDWAIMKTEMRRARLVVNRATGIGDHGIHSTPEKLKKMLDGHNTVYHSDKELTIKEFRL